MRIARSGLDRAGKALLFAALFLPVSLLSGAPARADDQPFVTIYSTDIDTAGARELEQHFIWKTDEANTRFNELESRSEFEYGITDDLQGSLYLNYDFVQTRAHDPLGSLETENAFGTSGELIWRLLNPYFDPVGLALYFEPSWSAKAHSFETKLLFQKDAFNDTLRNVININFEDVWEKNSLGHYDKTSSLEFDFGSSYNVTPDLSLGVELDNEHGFEGEILGGNPSEATDSFYLGPTVQYVAAPWSVTLGAQTQLPIAINPTGMPGTVRGGFTSAAEHVRATFRVTRDF